MGRGHLRPPDRGGLEEDRRALSIWAYRYSIRFGLNYIDYETQARTVKESGRWYLRVIREGGLDPSLPL
jgi:hypothetical protein